MNYEVLEFESGSTLAQAHGGYKSKVQAIEDARSLYKRDKRIMMIQVQNIDTGAIVYERRQVGNYR
jgi:hypothetical protein